MADPIEPTANYAVLLNDTITTDDGARFSLAADQPIYMRGEFLTAYLVSNEAKVESYVLSTVVG